VLLPATGASALALAAVTRLPEVILPETAVALASPLAPWLIAVADAVPRGIRHCRLWRSQPT
jgi:hypothetical protein